MGKTGTPESAATDRQAQLSRLGFAHGQVVQELGYDEDVDDAVVQAVEALTGAATADEEFTGAVDAVLLWWRSDDDDLVDSLVDALSTLVDDGFVVLLTPRPGQPGAVSAADVKEAASVAGLKLVGTAQLSTDWAATRLLAGHGIRR